MTADTSSLGQLLEELGFAPDYPGRCRQPCFGEPRQSELCVVEEGRYHQPVWCTTVTLQAWQAMRAHAAHDGIDLRIVSGYRSVRYQAEIFKRKMARGETLEEILRVNAVPGFSEHHSGRALDLGSTEEQHVLTEAFEHTRAFAWLCRHAGTYGFVLSYPRHNAQGFVYEPWHWCYQGE